MILETVVFIVQWQMATRTFDIKWYIFVTLGNIENLFVPLMPTNYRFWLWDYLSKWPLRIGDKKRWKSVKINTLYCQIVCSIQTWIRRSVLKLWKKFSVQEYRILRWAQKLCWMYFSSCTMNVQAYPFERIKILRNLSKRVGSVFVYAVKTFNWTLRHFLMQNFRCFKYLLSFFCFSETYCKACKGTTTISRWLWNVKFNRKRSFWRSMFEHIFVGEEFWLETLWKFHSISNWNFVQF
jgi:hypothetical protein